MAALESLTRPAAAEPAGALVLIHGRGTSEHDLFGLLDVLDPERRLLGACPRGPLVLPPGGAHWYVVPRVGFPDPETFRASAGALARWLGELGVAAAKTVIGGFSQGAVMSWALGAGPARPRPAGILALSGFIPSVPGWDLGTAALRGLPVAIAHGDADPVIPVELGRAARDAALSAGADVLYRETPVGHTVDPRVLGELAAWVRAATA